MFKLCFSLIKSIKLLKGLREEKPSDLKAIVDNLHRLSQLIRDFPEIEELDINPLMVLEEGKGAFTVDVTIGIKRNGHSLPKTRHIWIGLPY